VYFVTHTLHRTSIYDLQKKLTKKKIETNSQLYLVIFVKMICLIFVKKSEESVFLFWCRVEEFNETFSSLLNVVYSPTRVPN